MGASARSRTSETLTARSRRTRVALVAAVRAELAETGSFTADAVAERAGCSPATFYSHFGAKDDALTAAFEQTLTELVDLSIRDLDPAAFTTNGIEQTMATFVEEQTRFFRRESLVFRTAISRLPHHRPIRDAYRRAEQRTLDHCALVFHEIAAMGLIAPAEPVGLATAFMVAAQGLNNPRALTPAAADVRTSLTRGLSAILGADGGAA